MLILCALIVGAPFAGARGGGGRGFSGGRGGSSAVRGGSSVFRGGSSGGRSAAAGASGYSSGSGGFSRAVSRPAFGGRATAFRASARTGSFPASRAFGRTTSFHAAALNSSRRSAADTGGTSAPAWATPGAKIISAGRQPVYSDPGNGGTHSVEGGGFIAMDQGRANDVGRAPGITWGRPDRAPSSGAAAGGGSGGSSNGPAFDPSF